MQKFVILLSVATVLILSWCNTQNSVEKTDTTNSLQEKLSQTQQILSQPNRKMDLYGKIISNEGNEFTVQVVDTTQDPTFNMEPAEKRAYMQKLSQEERMALKDKIRQAVLWNEKVLIPVWTPIIVKLEQGPDGKEKMWSLADLTVGSYITVWLNQDVKDKKVAEFIKKSFTK